MREVSHKGQNLATSTRETLDAVDQELSKFGLEIVVFDHGDDCYVNNGNGIQLHCHFRVEKLIPPEVKEGLQQAKEGKFVDVDLDAAARKIEKWET